MLIDLQRLILDALIAEEPRDDVGRMVVAGRIGIARRLEVYRHNVMSNWVSALASIYPVTQRIVGETFFACAAEAYSRRHGSSSGDLNDFGDAWPTFIAAWPHAEGLPYLTDLGRLEWAWHRAFHAADVPPLDLYALANVAPDDHLRLRFVAHPSAVCVPSFHPLKQIWRVNQPDFTGSMAIDWNECCAGVLVWRQQDRMRIRQLDRASEVFLSALLNGGDADASASLALHINGAFDASAALQEAIREGVLAGFFVQA